MKTPVINRPNSILLNNYLKIIYEQHFIKLISSKYIFNNESVRFPLTLLNCECYENSGHCNNKEFNCSNCFFKAKENIFNHICTMKQTSTDSPREPGVYDQLRTERIPWINEILTEYTLNQNILYFNETNQKNRYTHYFWAKQNRYVVILKQYKTYYYFTSAYFVNYRSTEREFEGKFKRYKKSASKPTP